MQIDCLARAEAQAPARDENSFGNLYLSRQLSLNGGPKLPIVRPSQGISMIRVIAILTAKPGRRDDILALFKANVPAVLQEKGCLEYGPVIDAEGGGSNQAKLDAHRVAPHMAAFGRAAKDMFASRTIHVLSPA
jgi:quinol monooxygenase YgiN